MEYTLKDVPDEIDRALHERAAAEHKSLDRALLDALARGLEVEKDVAKRRDLSDVAGKRLITPAMKTAFDEQRRIDPELWR